MKQILYKLFEHQSLERGESHDLLIRMARGEFNDAQMAAFMTVFLMRSITIDELSGFRDALMEMRVPVDMSAYEAIDIVGTGGDNKNTFNISTAASFVVAGAGYKVVKHGNYGSSSISGASNVIQAHGVRFTADGDQLRRSIEESGVAFLHAQFFSPALKTVSTVRRDLGVRTFFNMLGPLVNPSMPRYQLLGVYNLKLARLYHYLYQEQQDMRYTIVTSLDGYDEVSLTSDFKIFDPEGQHIVSPEELGFARLQQEQLSGGDSIESALAIFDRVINGCGTAAQQSVVEVNAAYAIHTLAPHLSIEQCIAAVRESIESGRAQASLNKFIEVNR